MKRAAAILIIISIALITSFYFLPKPPPLTNINYSQTIFSAHGKLLRLTLTADQQYRVYTPLNKIAKSLIQATLLQEDRYFYWHLGVNPVALLKGLWTSYVLQKRRRGASTITMQLARMRYKLRTKTLSGKLKQIYYALLLERHYTKHQILQAYLNLAPYGGNIEGIGAASLIYFHEPPSQLTLAQALTLVVIPQNPAKRQPKLMPNNPELKTARARLLNLWEQQHPLTPWQKLSFELPLQFFTRKQLPFLAPHFVDYVLAQNKLNHDKSSWLQTTLNLELQNLILQQLTQFINQWHNRGINNAAVLLINANTMAIAAMQGSANFADIKIQGQVNATTAKRSPGSTLKPFIYALAIQQGLITPKSMVYDLPKQFNNYLPENMDAGFLGVIPADRALLLSRNIPAVELDQQLGATGLYHLLQQANISNLKPKHHYGLSLALGGGELTMLELGQLYATLLNHGVYRSLHYKFSSPAAKGKPLLTPEASFIILDTLTHNPSLGNINSGAWIKPKLKIAWKTGTSSGNRDAWAVGIFGHYVLIVWVGDFKAKSNAYLIGRVTAAPLLFNITAAIAAANPQLTNLPQPKHLNLKKISVCAATGMLPNQYCPKLTKTWFIPGAAIDITQ